MAGNSLNPTTIDQALYQQATDMANFYRMLKEKLVEWQMSLPSVAAANAVGYTDTNDQAAVIQWEADLAGLIAHIEGTESAANTRNLVNDFAILMKVS